MANSIDIHTPSHGRVVVDRGIAVTDDELERLKQEYREKIAELEAAIAAAEASKATLDNVTIELDGVAQEASVQGVSNKLGTANDAFAANTVFAKLNDALNREEHTADTLNDFALGITQSRSIPYQITVSNETYTLRGFEVENDILWVHWESLGNDLWTNAYNIVEAGCYVYTNISAATPTQVGTISAVQSISLQDIGGLIGDSSDASTDQTLFGKLAAVLSAVGNIDIDTSDLAKEASVKDGNDTAISVSKEVRSEVGTGSDTAAETGTLSAVLKWVKNKVKDIYNAITDNTNGLAAIKTAASSAATDAAAAKTAAQAITGYALQGVGNATQTDIASAIGTPASCHTIAGDVATTSATLSDMNDYLLHGAEIVENSDNVGSGNQGYTIILDQTQSVNEDTLTI